ncbi:MAG: hypothetical protein HOW73_12490 [Polyangiaceae bacterium]|nr:hypothetical protein [Polyangiaceae bacterium]
MKLALAPRTSATLLLSALGIIASTTTGCGIDLCDTYTNLCQGGAPEGGAGEGGGGGPSTGGQGGDGGSGGSIDQDCVPSLLDGAQPSLPEKCEGIFLSSVADDGGNGSRATPFNDLQSAIDAVNELEGTARVLYVCEGPYQAEDSVEIPENLTIYGGLSCDWRYTGDRATFKGIPNVPTLTFSGAGTRTVEDIDIEAAPASGVTGKHGNSSIAVLASQATVTFRRSRIEAGTGEDGGNADAPDAPKPQAPSGEPGDPGCVDASTNDGGAGGPNSCVLANGDEVDVSGGEGGLGDTDASAGDGDPGMPASMGGTPGDGQGSPGPSCTPGGPGESASNADPGQAASTAGTLAADGYHGPATPNGPRGAPGEGGGGGGGGKECTDATRGGAGGGGGGAGGCGGEGGKPGGAGGASIAIAAIANAVVMLETVQLVTQNGGEGGDGALGQSGQEGGYDMVSGVGGFPGSDSGDTNTQACAGGAGGRGGNGGPSAGADGGVSALIAFASGATVTRMGEPAGADSLGVSGNGGSGVGGAPIGRKPAECAEFDATTWACKQ